MRKGLTTKLHRKGMFLASCMVAILAAVHAGATFAGPNAYVANAGEASISVIDTATYAVVGTPIEVGFRPSELAIHPSGGKVYVANAYSDSVSVVDVASHTVIRTIEDVPLASSFAMNADGTRLYVATRFNVVEIDTATYTPIGDPMPVAVPDGPGCLKVVGSMTINPIGTRLYVPISDCYSGPYTAPGLIAVIDISSRLAVANIEVGQYPGLATVDPAGGRVYVTNWLGSSVSVLDTTNDTVLATINLGGDSRPTGALVDPMRRRLYVAKAGVHAIVVIDTVTNTAIGPDIPVGRHPASVALSSNGKQLFVANQTDSTVTIIDTDTLTVIGDAIAVGDMPVAIKVARADMLFMDGFDSP